MRNLECGLRNENAGRKGQGAESFILLRCLESFVFDFGNSTCYRKATPFAKIRISKSETISKSKCSKFKIMRFGTVGLCFGN
jgi:hypothetical protein